MKSSLKQVYAGIFGLSCCLAACAQDQGNGKEEDLATPTSPLVGHPTTIGVARSSGAGMPLRWLLRTSNSPGNPTIDFKFGEQWPMVGDWNGDGVTTIGAVKQVLGTWEWSLRNSNTAGGADIFVAYGSHTLGDVPVAGDWDGNGTVTIGVVRRNVGGNWLWLLRNSNTPGSPDLNFEYGSGTLNDIPVVGDWNGDGTTSIGVVRDIGTSWLWLLRNSNSPGFPDLNFSYGSPTLGDQLIVGDWDGNGTMTVGVTRPTCGPTSCPQNWRWLLRNSNTPGNPDLDFEYGNKQLGDLPRAGVWIP
jgi:hypothetical protein